MPWPSAICFDFDGVLLNSEPLHYLAYYEVLRHEGLALTEAEYYHELIGFDDAGAFRHFYKLKGKVLDPKTFLRLMTRKSEVMREIIAGRKVEALPGAGELVRGLVRHYPLAIVSGALREEIEVMLEGVGLRDCFRVIVAAEDVTVGKPDISGYLKGIEELGRLTGRTIKPADTLVVEDAPSVIANARAAGFVTLGVATSKPLSAMTEADYIVTSLNIEVVGRTVRRLKTVV